MGKYDHKKIDVKWQERWKKERIYQPDLSKVKRPFYNLMMFPYPSSEGLHVGNMYAFTGADVYGRFKRMQGYGMFQPIGLDGFGIHSENYAIKIGKHPAEQAKVSEKRFYDQLASIGSGFSWDQKLETYDADYYRWTQWIFVQMFKEGLAVRKKSMVNWCPSCKTVLADEQVEGGVCERCKTEAERRETKQWFFKITKFADRLLRNIEKIDWPERIKLAQRQWIGRKEGIDITYLIQGTKETLTCFTTRPDTNYGATFVVLAPEYPLVEKILHGDFDLPKETVEKVRKYVAQALRKTEQQRKIDERKKTGVFTGLYAVNQLNDQAMPVWVSDFVLMEVGTGAVVGVPGHDKRDFEFAKAFKLPVVRVVVGPDKDKSVIKKIEQVQEEEGVMVNSDFLNGMDIHDAIPAMMDHIEKKGWGKRTVSYHLRDWLVSRQRYWGPPIPMVFCQACAKAGKTFKGLSLQGHQSKLRQKPTFKGESFKGMEGWWPIPEEELPVKLPFVKDYKPTGDGKSPLEKAPEFWLYIKCPECGGKAKRETDVSDTFLDSSWYFLAYPNLGTEEWKRVPTRLTGNPRQAGRDDLADWESLSAESSGGVQNRGPFNREITKKWLPVDAYIAGAEHAVLHLLYSRFVTMALHDWGYLEFEEPFPFLYSHGLIIKDGAKMSKSKGNVVIPDDYIIKYGSDTLRMYLMFLGPYDQGGDFRDSGIAGMSRFLNRVWSMYQSDKVGSRTSIQLVGPLQRTIKKFTEDLGKFRYNTAIAAIMEFMNEWQDGGKLSKEDAGVFVKLLAPLAVHMAEELWQGLEKAGKGGFKSIHVQPWPKYDDKLAQLDEIEIPIQVNGKLRGRVVVAREEASDKNTVVAKAKKHPVVSKYLKKTKEKKTIWLKAKLINFVTD